MDKKRLKTLDEARKEHIRKVLRCTHGDVDQASRILGITASVLRRRIKEYGLILDEKDQESDQE
jgi:DNA-binding NtrC family response regulator